METFTVLAKELAVARGTEYGRRRSFLVIGAVFPFAGIAVLAVARVVSDVFGAISSVTVVAKVRLVQKTFKRIASVIMTVYFYQPDLFSAIHRTLIDYHVRLVHAQHLDLVTG